MSKNYCISAQKPLNYYIFLTDYCHNTYRFNLKTKIIRDKKSKLEKYDSINYSQLFSGSRIIVILS